ncbi:MAG: ribulokinase [Planctomycetota bacterium]|nr:MAG: ribulokinase [Planctomycetota bacterium]
MSSSNESDFLIGVDYGTESVRALIVEAATGKEVASAVWGYAHGTSGVVLDAQDPNLARQHPADYHQGFVHAVRGALSQAADWPGFAADRIRGIGVDTTGSTPIPVDANGVALAMQPEFGQDPMAMAWLWKDHTSYAEAAEITDLALNEGRPYLAKCGGTYSSEWYWSKILRCERQAPKVAAAAYGWVELCDYVPGFLTGHRRPENLVRSACAAGHKAMHHPDWQGLPAEDFLERLSPGLGRFRQRYDPEVRTIDHCAGGLLPELAAQVGLPAGVPVAAGAFDAHLGAVGAGAAPGVLIKILGTSTCDCIVAPMDAGIPDVPGVCGIVPGSILPGMLGIEAGQSAVGDIFQWYLGRIAPGGCGSGPEDHARFNAEAARWRPGESGLVALDWHNGNRTVLVDPLLSGLLVGQTLHTTPAEVYRAWIEATAFGARKIIDRLAEYGVNIERVINCGGIAEKSPLVMQIYADVCGRPMEVSRSPLTCALGAAMAGGVAGGRYPDIPAAQKAMSGVRSDRYLPDAPAVAVYDRLYRLYSDLHDAFGLAGASVPLDGIMKELMAIRREVRQGQEAD